LFSPIKALNSQDTPPRSVILLPESSAKSVAAEAAHPAVWIGTQKGVALISQSCKDRSWCPHNAIYSLLAKQQDDNHDQKDKAHTTATDPDIVGKHRLN
jgi:hypothetical protein